MHVWPGCENRNVWLHQYILCEIEISKFVYNQINVTRRWNTTPMNDIIQMIDESCFR